jgi:hypothetical protein
MTAPIDHNPSHRHNIQLLTIPSGAQCSACDSFRPNQSICTTHSKPIKWYNKCEFFVRARTGNTSLGELGK